MSSLLRRLTTQLDQTAAIQSGPEEDQFQRNHQVSEVDARDKGKLASAVSFNDFSMHVMLDGDHQVQYDETPCDASTMAGCEKERPMTQPVSIPTASQGVNMSNNNDKAPPSPLFISKTLKVPRTSVASILGTPKASTVAAAETPRSSLDLIETSSMPTPRASLSSRDAEGDGSVPVSPRSPKTPGGRRKKQNKIHGLDYYEFCELVRAGSL